MSGPPFMPFYVGDYLRDTMHLKTHEHGAYLLLIFASWTHGGKIANDDQVLASITKCTIAEWQILKPKMAKFFMAKGDFWVSKRVNLELQKTDHIRQVRVKAGKSGAAKRWQNHGSRARTTTITTTISDSKESAPSTARRDPVRGLWSRGVQLLRDGGTDERRARKLIGQWRQHYGDVPVSAALTRAEAESPADPVAFLIGVLGNGAEAYMGDGHGFGSPGFA
jgi:uncharacterized protein YdaU (DUF1376 family)